MLTVTETAGDTLYHAMDSAGLGEGYAARLTVLGRTLSGFKYDFRTVPVKDRSEDDHVLDLGQFSMYVDARSMEFLHDTVIDVKPDGGLKIENPNPVITSDLQRQVAELIETQINPGVSMHGGQIILVDVKDHTVYVNMEGGCKGCGLARTTFRMGIEKMIREAIPAVQTVVDVTEHDKGINPYYQPDAPGQSPMED